MQYDVVFPSTFVKSLILGFIEDDSSFATHFVFVTFFRDLSLRWWICSSVSSSPSSGVKRNCSSSATSEEVFVTSMGFVLYILPDYEMDPLCDFQFLFGEKIRFCVDWTSNLCFLKLNCRTYSHALHKNVGIAFVWKNGWPTFWPLRQSSVLMIPTENVQTQRRPCILSKNRSNNMTSWVVRGKGFWSKRNRRESFYFW